MINYISIARGGDLPGMANPGEVVSVPVTTKTELALWRKFNKLNKIYLEAASLFVAGNTKSHQKIFDAASEAFYAAHRELGAHYGDEWSKWHARTRWVTVQRSSVVNRGLPA
jgi:hypothetical protein